VTSAPGVSLIRRGSLRSFKRDRRRDREREEVCACMYMCLMCTDLRTSIDCSSNVGFGNVVI